MTGGVGIPGVVKGVMTGGVVNGVNAPLFDTGVANRSTVPSSDRSAVDICGLKLKTPPGLETLDGAPEDSAGDETPDGRRRKNPGCIDSKDLPPPVILLPKLTAPGEPIVTASDEPIDRASDEADSHEP